MTIYGFLATLVFSGFIIFDTHMLLKRHTYNEYVVAAISLYLDVINLLNGPDVALLPVIHRRFHLNTPTLTSPRSSRTWCITSHSLTTLAASSYQVPNSSSSTMELETDM